MTKKGKDFSFPDGTGIGGFAGEFMNKMLDDGMMDSKLLSRVSESCPTLDDKANLVIALLLQRNPQEREDWEKAIFQGLYMADQIQLQELHGATRWMPGGRDITIMCDDEECPCRERRPERPAAAVNARNRSGLKLNGWRWLHGHQWEGLPAKS